MNEHQNILRKLGQPMGVELLNKALRNVKPNQHDDLLLVLVAALSALLAALDRGLGVAFTDALVKTLNDGMAHVRQAEAQGEADQAGRKH